MVKCSAELSLTNSDYFAGSFGLAVDTCGRHMLPNDLQ